MNKINYILIATAIILIFFIYRKTRKKTSDKWQILKSQKLRTPGNGSGEYLANRTGGRKHKGVDLTAEINENVKSPFSGEVTKIYNVYSSNSQFKGIDITAEDTTARIMYVLPNSNIQKGYKVKKGQKIGIAQNIASFHGGGMENHVHIEKKVNGTHQDPTKDLL